MLTYEPNFVDPSQRDTDKLSSGKKYKALGILITHHLKLKIDNFYVMGCCTHHFVGIALKKKNLTSLR